LDLAAKRWDDVNKKYEYEIYRKWGELKSSLFLIEEVEGEIKASMPQPAWLRRRHVHCLSRPRVEYDFLRFSAELLKLV
jgi:hypothetical protein